MRSEQNLGFPGGCNLGMRFALGTGLFTYLWLLNNDVWAEEGSLRALRVALEAEPQAGMAGSLLLYYHRPEVVQALGGARIYPALGNTVFVLPSSPEDRQRAAELDYVCGASCLLRAAVAERLGLMREDYFMYWEDADWGLRARECGYRLLYCPDSTVWHKEGGTSGALKDAADYYWVRNGLRFTLEHYPLYLPLVVMAYLLKYTVIRWARSQPLHLRACLQGLADFFRGRRGQRR